VRRRSGGNIRTRCSRYVAPQIKVIGEGALPKR
jgi:hypothetical protein